MWKVLIGKRLFLVFPMVLVLDTEPVSSSVSSPYRLMGTKQLRLLAPYPTWAGRIGRQVK